MKRMIRRGVFETNSSSVHSLTMCSDEEYEAWENGELIYDRYSRKFIPNKELTNNRSGYFDNPDSYFDYIWDECQYKPFDEVYTTPNGEVIHAFGYYGENR